MDINATGGIFTEIRQYYQRRIRSLKIFRFVWILIACFCIFLASASILAVNSLQTRTLNNLTSDIQETSGVNLNSLDDLENIPDQVFSALDFGLNSLAITTVPFLLFGVFLFVFGIVLTICMFNLTNKIHKYEEKLVLVKHENE